MAGEFKMTTRSPNLLLDDAAAPANGIGRGNVLQWYGGPLRIFATGVFDGATVTVQFATKLPKTGDRADYLDTNKFKNTDFIAMDAITAPGSYDLGDVNPCALAISVSGSGANSRIRVALG